MGEHLLGVRAPGAPPPRGTKSPIPPDIKTRLAGTQMGRGSPLNTRGRKEYEDLDA